MNSLKIIDELTGRILEGRRFGDGLHQALEAKEKIEFRLKIKPLASITYQNYFKLYKKFLVVLERLQLKLKNFLKFII